MKQRFFILLALFLIPILITGCSQENTSHDDSTSSFEFIRDYLFGKRGI